MAEQETKTVEEMSGPELDELAERLGDVEGYKKSLRVDAKRELLAPRVEASRTAEAAGGGAAAEGEPGTAPTGPNGADDGQMEPPSSDPDGADTPDETPQDAGAAVADGETHPAVAANEAVQPGEPTDGPEVGDTPQHPLPTSEEHQQREAAAIAETDVAATGDVVEHPVPTRESYDEQQLAQGVAVGDEHDQSLNAVASPDAERDYTRGWERGDLTAEERRALAKR